MINPEWKEFICQECVEKLPYLKQLITPAANHTIKMICTHGKKE